MLAFRPDCTCTIVCTLLQVANHDARFHGWVVVAPPLLHHRSAVQFVRSCCAHRQELCLVLMAGSASMLNFHVSAGASCRRPTQATCRESAAVKVSELSARPTAESPSATSVMGGHRRFIRLHGGLSADVGPYVRTHGDDRRASGNRNNAHARKVLLSCPKV